MSKNVYWVADPGGTLAVVEGAAARDEWTRVHGWTEVAEPRAGDMVWLQHSETGGRAKFPIEAAEQWAALGWRPAAPVPAPDLTKDPALVDQPPAEAAPLAEPLPAPVKPKTTSATGGEQSKETSRG